MSRASRLLDLVQLLRRHRRPVAGAALAAELGVSLRTLYRDVTTLVAQGAPIEGEAGLGYVLRPGFVLPPLMFEEEEVEAIILGLRFVAGRTDAALARGAANAAAKIAAVLPAERREDASAVGLLAAAQRLPGGSVDLALLRRAIRLQRRLRLAYRDRRQQVSERIVWPVAIGFFDEARVLAAWCETREDFRHFRTDRIVEAEMLEDRYPGRRAALLQAWRQQAGVPDQL